MTGPFTPSTTTSTTTAGTAGTAERTPQPRRTCHLRSLALAVALSATTTGLLAGPAHAADTTPKSTATPSPTASSDDSGVSSSDRAPRAANPDDQSWVTRTWHALVEKITGSGDDEAASDDSSDAADGTADGSGSSASSSGESNQESSTDKAIAAVPAAATNTTLTAEGLVNSIGVGMHVAYLDRAYGKVDSVALAEDLGVKHIRDGLGSNDSVPIESMKRLSKAGISINWVAQPEDSSFTIDDQLALIKNNDLNVTSVEGVNERDNHGDPDWASKVRAHQTQLYSGVKDTLGKNVAVVAPSLVHDESRAQLGEVPSDVANSHPYTGGAMQTAAITEHQVQMAAQVTPEVDTSTPKAATGRTTLSAAVKDSGAMWATELGFHTATDSTPGNGVQPYVSEDAQATLQLQQLLANFSNGVDRSYIYELMDEGSNNAEAEDRFGLAHSDGSPKPVFTALKNLIATIEHGGPAGTAGAAPVSVQVSGGSDVTTSLVLPRADGSTVVAVWEASPVWDNQAEKPLDVPEHKVSLDLGEDVDAQVFAPRQGSKALSSEKGVNTVSLTSQAAPTIVVLAPR